MKKWLISIMIALITLIVSGLFLSYFLQGDDENDYKQVQRFHNKNEITVDSITQKINTKNYHERFPYQMIAENIGLSDIQKQKQLLSYGQYSDTVIDSYFQELVFVAMTDQLQKVYQQDLNFHDLSTLLSLTNEVASLHTAGMADEKNALYYQATYDYWMQFIVGQLEKITSENYWSKYAFEYQYINTVCESYNYNPSTGLSRAEKVIYNFSKNRYSYLFSRFISQTTYLQKTIVFLIISISTFSTFFTFYTLTKSKKS